MSESTLIPRCIAEVTALARVFASSSLVTAGDIDAARARKASTGCEVMAAIEADMFLKILAGASRNIDPATACSYFAVYNGQVRAIREAPLALILRAGVLTEIDERVITFDTLSRLELILDDAEARDAWLGRDGSEQKLVELQRRADERKRQLSQTGGDDVDKGYLAAVCAVSRGGVWSVKIQDLQHAQARGLLQVGAGGRGDWWARFREEALKYSARQPLLREVFADIIGGLTIEGEDDHGPEAAPSPIPEAAEAEDQGLREGVARA
jgi:hypothetical protein